jgi:hypothetical protein
VRPEGATSGKVVVTTPTGRMVCNANFGSANRGRNGICVSQPTVRAVRAHSDLETCRTITTEIGICCRVEPLVADTVTE